MVPQIPVKPERKRSISPSSSIKRSESRRRSSIDSFKSVQTSLDPKEDLSEDIELRGKYETPPWFMDDWVEPEEEMEVSEVQKLGKRMHQEVIDKMVPWLRIDPLKRRSVFEIFSIAKFMPKTPSVDNLFGAVEVLFGKKCLRIVESDGSIDWIVAVENMPIRILTLKWLTDHCLNDDIKKDSYLKGLNRDDYSSEIEECISVFVTHNNRIVYNLMLEYNYCWRTEETREEMNSVMTFYYLVVDASNEESEIYEGILYRMLEGNEQIYNMINYMLGEGYQFEIEGKNLIKSGHWFSKCVCQIRKEKGAEFFQELQNMILAMKISMGGYKMIEHFEDKTVNQIVEEVEAERVNLARRLMIWRSGLKQKVEGATVEESNDVPEEEPNKHVFLDGTIIPEPEPAPEEPESEITVLAKEVEDEIPEEIQNQIPEEIPSQILKDGPGIMIMIDKDGNDVIPESGTPKEEEVVINWSEEVEKEEKENEETRSEVEDLVKDANLEDSIVVRSLVNQYIRKYNAKSLITKNDIDSLNAFYSGVGSKMEESDRKNFIKAMDDWFDRHQYIDNLWLKSINVSTLDKEAWNSLTKRIISSIESGANEKQKHDIDLVTKLMLNLPNELISNTQKKKVRGVRTRLNLQQVTASEME